MLEPVPEDVRPHSKLLWETDQWLVGVPLSIYAMCWWGSFTDWCVAREPSYFESYTQCGPVVVFRSRITSFRWALHASTSEFRDFQNKRVSWRGFLMRHPEVADDMMSAVGNLAYHSVEKLGVR